MLETLNLSDAEIQSMVAAVNDDLLPFYDEHSEMDFNFSKEYKVSNLLGESGKDYIFERVSGGQIGIWKDYFVNPEEWKRERELKLKGLFY